MNIPKTKYFIKMFDNKFLMCFYSFKNELRFPDFVSTVFRFWNHLFLEDQYFNSLQDLLWLKSIYLKFWTFYKLIMYAYTHIIIDICRYSRSVRPKNRVCIHYLLCGIRGKPYAYVFFIFAHMRYILLKIVSKMHAGILWKTHRLM